MRKNCSKCHDTKEDIFFSKSSKSTDGLQAWCKMCTAEARMESYYRNHVVERKKANLRNRLARQALMVRVFEYLDQHPCETCGETDPRVLQFDHLDRKDKIAPISILVKNYHRWDSLLEEIRKCQILCANCHAKRTAVQLGYYKYLEYKGEFNKS